MALMPIVGAPSRNTSAVDAMTAGKHEELLSAISKPRSFGGPEGKGTVSSSMQAGLDVVRGANLIRDEVQQAEDFEKSVLNRPDEEFWNQIVPQVAGSVDVELGMDVMDPETARRVMNTSEGRAKYLSMIQATGEAKKKQAALDAKEAKKQAILAEANNLPEEQRAPFLMKHGLMEPEKAIPMPGQVRETAAKTGEIQVRTDNAKSEEKRKADLHPLEMTGKKLANEKTQSEIDKAKSENGPGSYQIPGLEYIGQGTPDKDDVKKAKDAKVMFDDLVPKVVEYRSMFKKYGTEVMPGEVKGRMEALQSEIALVMKNLHTLGALSGPDLEILNNMVPPITGGKAAITRNKTIEGKLGALEDQVRSRINNNLKVRGYQITGSLPRGVERTDPNDPVQSSIDGKVNSMFSGAQPTVKPKKDPMGLFNE